jgi:hypothetical protein
MCAPGARLADVARVLPSHRIHAGFVKDDRGRCHQITAKPATGLMTTAAPATRATLMMPARAGHAQRPHESMSATRELARYEWTADQHADQQLGATAVPLSVHREIWCPSAVVSGHLPGK